MRRDVFRAGSWAVRTARGILKNHRLLAVTLCAALLPLAAGGCGSAAGQPSLTVNSLTTHQRYEQQFATAYAGRSDRGLDVVLVSDQSLTQPGTAVTASASGPTGLKQVMHVRVLWAPAGPIKVNSPASTNACIHWYVFTDDPRHPEVLEYTGTAMAMIDPDGDTTSVKIRNASLKPTAAQGRLNDPIGSATFEGDLVARNNRQRVDELLSEVKATLAAAKVTKAQPEGQARASTATP